MSLQSDEEWCLFYCDSTLGCWVIEDIYLCKLDDFWCHNLDTKWHIKNHKKWNIIISEDFFFIELKLWTVVTLIPKFHDISIVTLPWKHRLQALSIQKVKSEFSSFKKCYLLLLFIQCLWANMEITQHKHKEVCETLEQQIRHFSFKVEIWQQVCFYGDIITTITMCSFCSRSTLQNFNPVDLCSHCDVKSPLICINQNTSNTSATKNAITIKGHSSSLGSFS